MPLVPEQRHGAVPASSVNSPTDAPVLSATPGWYPDPEGSGDRWWTGRAWSDGNLDRPAPAQASTNRPAVAAMPADSYLASASESPATNRPATVGLVLGLVCLVVNPVLLCGVAAVIASGIGLNRASLMGQHGYSAVGRAKAWSGIGLALVGTALSILLKHGLF